ncbi:T9SS type A sorting domain-containing protein [Polaribacter vadi]|uniref:T9SS type A sorting domain-containing protein n=1 Tax=Polaribacter TaxID=52959 RepID=UPI001C091150|nr:MULTISPECIES: T9SS type A sorting domain-containing protein [Polaribacter]MBU3010975.1 T9SS type A sorting domain-containing protein [Polaribacter vadi]MDO6740788.1 T9SS type A sorting domain-containing protein [Polaribacter sp. 1_MG-2023]
MKIAFSYTGKTVFINFLKLKISYKHKKFLINLNLKLIIFLLSISPFFCFSTTKISKAKILDSRNFSKSDSLKLPKTTVYKVSDLDTDLDGVSDILDLDDDNDGILDNDEGFRNLHSLKNEGIVITINGSWVLVDTSVYFILPPDLSHGDEFWVPFLGLEYVKAVRIRFENTENGIKFIQTTAKHTIGNDPDLDTNLNYDFDNGGIIAPVALADEDEGYGVASIMYLDKVIISDYLSTSGKIWEAIELDTDNDGLINSRDTDSDNDGCSDAIEAQNNIPTTATLIGGSINGGSLENLGVISNNYGIPLPLGTINGNETIGQSNNNTAIISEQLNILPLTDISANSGDNVSVTVTASAIKTATFNLGIPNYSDAYGLETSDLIEYKWYRKDNLNSVVSTSKTLVFNDVSIANSGDYIVEIKGAGNTCVFQESVSITVDDVLGISDNYKKEDLNFVAYPNPSKGNVNLLLNSIKETEVNVYLFDITGKEIYSVKERLNEGENKIQFSVKVDPGVLFLKVVGKEVNYGTSKIFFK